MAIDIFQVGAQLGAPASKVSNVRYDNSGQQAVARESSQTGRIIQAGVEQVREQIIRTDVLQANNEYVKRTNDLRMQLMQKKEKGALDIVGEYEAGERKIRSELMAQSPQSVKYGKGAMLFDYSTQQTDNANRRVLGQYRAQQFEAWQNTTFANSINSSVQKAVLSPNDPAVIADVQKEIDYAINSRYGTYGRERLDLEYRKWTGVLGQALIDRSYANGDINTAEAYVEKYGPYMDPGVTSAYAKNVYARKQEERLFNMGQNLYATFGEDEGAARDYIFGDNFKTEVDGKAIVKAASADIGNNYGENTCTISINRWLRSAGAKEGNTWAPTNMEDAKDNGVFFTQRNQLRNGDIVYWDWEDNDDSDHVGVYDASTGKVIQSGTHGVAALDLDHYKVLGFAHPISDAPTLEDRQKAWNNYVQQKNINDAIKANQQNMIIKNIEQRLWDNFKTGIIDSQDMRNMVFSASGGDADVERTLLKFGDDLIGIQTKAAAAVSNSGIYKSIKDAITNSTVTPAEAVSLINQNATVLGEADRSRLLAFARNQDPRNKDVDKQLATMINEALSDPVERGEAQIYLDNAIEDKTDPQKRYDDGYGVLYGTKDKPGILKNKAIFKNYNSKQREWGSLKSSLSPKLYPYIDAYQIQNGNNIDLGQAKTIFESINPNDKYQISALQYATVYNSPMDIQELNKQIAAMAVRDGVDAAPHLLEMPQQNETAVQQNESAPWFSDWGASERTGLAAMNFSDAIESIKQRHLAALRGEINEEW
ncbi:hypothetical protein [Phascolarctobacterium faecium]|uniref:hypothetical protein n=1 Tax=Phascolarctobacterium faecium TaxID=33025 RepID=UPI00242ADFB9|nr:hypothetical protein [Phascolarctobacterium faecium]